MDERDMHLARSRFRARIDSLRRDIHRCFWTISDPGAPAPALFPAIMYCFATLDLFSAFWGGQVPNDNQSKRMADFLCTYLLYPKEEAFVALTIWRHKLMHTAEPRIVTSDRTPAVTYIWEAGFEVSHHLQFVKTDKSDEFRIGFGCNQFVRDLEEGVFWTKRLFSRPARR